MLYIDPHTKKNMNACENHVRQLKSKIIKAIDKTKDSFIIEKIKPYVSKILSQSPKWLKEKSSEINKEINKLPSPKKEKINNNLKTVFNYKNFSIKKKEYDAYNLADNLDIQTCVYCNRLYTKTVSKGKNKITRPQFDHWFSQEKHPILKLSFYNLIPSCSICNATIKGRAEMELTKHLHPYVDNTNDIIFSYKLKAYGKYDFFVKGATPKAKNTIDFFKLREIYSAHEDEIRDLVLIKQYYSNTYLNSLKKILSKKSVPSNDLYRLAFGVYLREKEFEKRPLSRMKRDILMELGII